MPRIVLVSHWDWVLHHFRLPIAAGLAAAGADVHLVSPPGPWVGALRRTGLPWHRWDVDRASLRPGRELRSVVALTRLMRRLRPDAVHLFTIKPILDGAVAARLAGVPQVVAAFSGLGWLFSPDDTASRLRPAVLAALRLALRGATVTALNPADLARLRDTGIAAPTRSRLVPEGVDLGRFQPRDRPTSDGPVRLVCACRLLHAKGIGELVAATQALTATGRDVETVIAGAPDPGNPDTATAEDITRWARLPGVSLPGPTDRVDELLRSADIAVLPTRYPEGAPRFLQEAAAMGVPAVTTDLPGCRQVVTDGVTGRIVAAGDVHALTAALAELIDTPELRRRLGEAARRRALGEFDEQRAVAAHVALYRDLRILT